MKDFENHISDRIEHLAWYLDIIKNGMSVKLDGNKAVTRIFTGQKMILDVTDRSLAPHLLLDGHWELGISKLFQKFTKPGDIVFDVGANFGYFSLVAGTKIGNGQIHALEANPSLIEFLELNANINGLSNQMYVGHYLISDERPPLRLKIFKDYLGNSAMEDIRVEEWSDIDSIVDVENITLDKYCSIRDIDHIDLMKMDIEGAEFRGIRGMQRMINQSKEKLIIFLEYTPKRYDVENEAFIKYILNFFSNVYRIENDGTFAPISDWKSEELSMLILTNRDIIAEKL